MQMAQIQSVEVHGDADIKNPRKLDLKVGVRIVNSVNSFGM